MRVSVEKGAGSFLFAFYVWGKDVVFRCKVLVPIPFICSHLMVQLYWQVANFKLVSATETCFRMQSFCANCKFYIFAASWKTRRVATHPSIFQQQNNRCVTTQQTCVHTKSALQRNCTTSACTILNYALSWRKNTMDEYTFFAHINESWSKHQNKNSVLTKIRTTLLSGTKKKKKNFNQWFPKLQWSLGSRVFCRTRSNRQFKHQTLFAT